MRRIRAAVPLASIELASLRIQERTAARAAPFLGEERIEGRHRVDLAAARPAREARHLRILTLTTAIARIRDQE